MDGALVIVEDDPTTIDLLAEAGRYAASQDAPLYLFAMVSTEELERTVSTLDQIGEIENTTYSDDVALEQARSFLEDTADDALEEGTSYETICRVVDDDDRVQTTLETAREHGCDHIFTTGKKRSPTGKALFGDFTQALLLDFDGRVTVDLNS